MSCSAGAGSWCRGGRCSATRWRSACRPGPAGPDGAGRRRRAGRRAAGRLRSHGPDLDPAAGRRRVVHALIFTPVFSRHCFVWLTFRQTTEDGDRRVRGGVGVLRRRVRDGDPRQHVGDRRAAPIRSSRGSTRRSSSTRRPAGSSSTRPGCARRRTSRGWSGRCSSCAARSSPARLRRSRRRAAPGRDVVPPAGRAAGARHDPGPTGRGVRRRGAAPAAAGADRRPTTCRSTRRAKVHRDHHIEVARSLYSVPGEPDRRTGSRCAPTARWCGSSTGASSSRSIPASNRAIARPIPTTCRRAGPSTRCETSTGCAAWPPSTARPSAPTPSALLDIPLPWTKMRQVYALLGLVKKWGAAPRRRRLRQRARPRGGQRRAHRPHARARHREHDAPTQPSLPGVVVAGRFARDPDALRRPTTPKGGAAMTAPRRSPPSCGRCCAG